MATVNGGDHAEAQGGVEALRGDVYIDGFSYTSETQVRTNIDIDDKLMAEAMELMSARTKKQAVEDALREAVQRRRSANAILALRGKVEWVGDLDAMRRDK
jgi:Arc/MetJ family transcription regulator